MTGDTLEENPFDGTKFHAIIANPPFSVSWNPDAHKEDPIFDGWPKLPPKSKADYAFIAHILSRLTDYGTAVVMVYPGILYRGNAEGAIREYLARRGCFERIENVPGGTFDDTSISTVIITLRKGGCKACMFVEGDRQAEATIDDMAAQGFNLSPSAYLPSGVVKEQIDIRAVNREVLDAEVANLRAYLKLCRMICESQSEPDEHPPMSEVLKAFREVLDEQQ